MSYDGRVYTVELAGLQRKLPIFEVAPGCKIAIFNMLGDTQAVETAADALAARVPDDADVMIVPEVKAVPLGHALSVREGLPYVVVRKIRKPYMLNCLEAEVVSITTGEPQTLYLDGKDLHLVQGKRGSARGRCGQHGQHVARHAVADAEGARRGGGRDGCVYGGRGRQLAERHFAGTPACVHGLRRATRARSCVRLGLQQQVKRCNVWIYR